MLTNTPGMISTLKLGMDSTHNMNPVELCIDGTKYPVHHKRYLEYTLTFNYRITCTKEFCKHMINFCLLGCPCTTTIANMDDRYYLSLSAENSLCTFKNLFNVICITDNPTTNTTIDLHFDEKHEDNTSGHLSKRDSKHRVDTRYTWIHIR